MEKISNILRNSKCDDVMSCTNELRLADWPINHEKQTKTSIESQSLSEEKQIIQNSCQNGNQNTSTCLNDNPIIVNLDKNIIKLRKSTRLMTPLRLIYGFKFFRTFFGGKNIVKFEKMELEFIKQLEEDIYRSRNETLSDKRKIFLDKIIEKNVIRVEHHVIGARSYLNKQIDEPKHEYNILLEFNECHNAFENFEYNKYKNDSDHIFKTDFQEYERKTNNMTPSIEKNIPFRNTRQNDGAKSLHVRKTPIKSPKKPVKLNVRKRNGESYFQNRYNTIQNMKCGSKFKRKRKLMQLNRKLHWLVNTTHLRRNTIHGSDLDHFTKTMLTPTLIDYDNQFCQLSYAISWSCSNLSDINKVTYMIHSNHRRNEKFDHKKKLTKAILR